MKDFFEKLAKSIIIQTAKTLVRKVLKNNKEKSSNPTSEILDLE